MLSPSGGGGGGAAGAARRLYSGAGARAFFFAGVIGLQFFLYDAIRVAFGVGTEDLELALDVFAAIRQTASTIGADALPAF